MQGVTEVLPVSSSAHLALLPRLLGWAPPAHRTALSAALHAGSAAGLAWGLRRELAALTRSELVRVALSTLPAAAAGLVLEQAVERRLGGPRATAGLLAGAGLLLAAVDARADRRADRPTSGPDAAASRSGAAASRSDVLQDPAAAARHRRTSGAAVGLTGREALVTGLAQAAALAPGVSRSGAVLTALRADGVPLARAQRVSLLLSLPVTAGAAVLPLARLAAQDPEALRQLAPLLAAGVPAAAVSAGVALSTVRSPPTRAVALYRLALAAAFAASSTAARGSA